MSLDDKLNKLFNNANKTPNLESHSEELKESLYKNIDEHKTTLETAKNGSQECSRLQAQANMVKNELNEIDKIFHEYQENIKTASAIQTKIIKGVQSGENIKKLFLLACECISKMTANKVFYNQVHEDLKVYGHIFNDLEIIKNEMEETQKRLNTLKVSYEREQVQEVKERILTAIKEHENKVQELKNKVQA